MNLIQHSDHQDSCMKVYLKRND